MRREPADAAIPNNPDAKTIFHAAPHIQYQQLKLTDSFRKYLAASFLYQRVLRTGIKPTIYLKYYKINTGIKFFVADFKSSNNQFSF